MGFLFRHCSGKGAHVALRGESPGFSEVEVGNISGLIKKSAVCYTDLCKLLLKLWAA